MKKRKILMSVFLVILCLTFSACSKEPEGPEDQLIYYNIDSEPITLDPQIANDAGAKLVIMNIFEGLVRLDQDNSVKPGAAESWEISTDKMMYTFKLRKNLKWNDGSDMKAEDFVYGIKRTLMPQTSSPTASTLYCIKNAEKINTGNGDIDTLGVFIRNNDTIIFQLEYPDSDFLSLLASANAMPCNKDFFDKTAGQYGREGDKILCNGAFFIRENGWAHDEYIYLRKNSEYKGAEKPVPLGVNITIGKQYDDVCRAIKNGDIDCGSITGADTDKAEKYGFHLTSFGDTVWGISFNTNDEVLKNTNIRCALVSSLDRKKLLSSLPENCIITQNIIPDSARIENKSYRSLAGNVSPEFKKNSSQFLSDGIKETGISFVTNITILCTDDEKTQTYVNNIIETWNNLTGGYFNKKPVPLSELKDRLESGDYEAVIAPLTIQGNTPLSTLELFESGGKNSISFLSSPEYDKIIREVRKNITVGEIQNMKAAENYLLSNGVFYPLYIENRYYASAANVKNIIFHPFGAEADFFYAAKQPEE